MICHQLGNLRRGDEAFSLPVRDTPTLQAIIIETRVTCCIELRISNFSQSLSDDKYAKAALDDSLALLERWVGNIFGRFESHYRTSSLVAAMRARHAS
jgi:hypothetical protein